MIVYLNGAWVDAADASIAIDDRGFLAADGVFETARLVDGVYFRLDQHLERLSESAAQLKLAVPPADQLRAVFAEIALRNTMSEGSLRITITRGRPAGPQTVLVTLSPIAADWRVHAAHGWHLITAKTRRPSSSSVPAQLKALGRVYSILARLEAEAAGADDALLLTADGAVAEGPTWNFFWVKDRTIRTGALEGGILEGITRGIILQLAEQAGYETEEGLWPPSDLEDADEAFASMTSLGLVPIRSLDGHAFPSDDVARLLQREYWNFVQRSLTQ